MKKSKRILALLLATLTFGSMVACKNDSNKSGKKNEEDYMAYNVVGDVQGTTHERAIGETSFKFLENGRSDYALVVPKNAGTDISKAYAEFNTFFFEATGIRLNVITDEDIVYSETAKYVSLGETALLQGAGLSTDESLVNDGYEIITKGASIFVMGSERGVLYGVYDMMKYLVGYETYSPNYYEIQKNVTEIKLPAFDIKEIPDFRYRIIPGGNVSTKQVVQTRLRMNTTGEAIMMESVHNAFIFLPPQEYLSDEEYPDGKENTMTFTEEEYARNRKWYSTTISQLCHTAHGDEEAYEALIDEMSKNCLKMIAENEQDYISITQMDNGAWCNCAACTEVINRNGGHKFVTQSRFINDIEEKVNAFLQTDEAGKDKGRVMNFIVFAYQDSVSAPVIKQEDGSFVPTSDEVLLNDNVAVWLAPIRANYLSTIYDVNNDLLYTLKSWSAIAPQFFVWAYDAYFKRYISPFDSWNTMQDLAKELYQCNTILYWPQGTYNQGGSSHFDNLKAYVWSKLLWNVNVDITECVNDYFRAVYRDSAEIMKQSYWMMRSESLRHRLELNRPHDCMTDTALENYYSKQYLLEQFDLINSAFKPLEKYKVLDPDYYEAVTLELNEELIFPEYMLLKLYWGTLNANEKAYWKNDFVKKINAASMGKESEGGGLNDFINKLK